MRTRRWDEPGAQQAIRGNSIIHCLLNALLGWDREQSRWQWGRPRDHEVNSACALLSYVGRQNEFETLRDVLQVGALDVEEALQMKRRFVRLMRFIAQGFLRDPIRGNRFIPLRLYSWLASSLDVLAHFSC